MLCSWWITCFYNYCLSFFNLISVFCLSAATKGLANLSLIVFFFFLRRVQNEFLNIGAYGVYFVRNMLVPPIKLKFSMCIADHHSRLYVHFCMHRRCSFFYMLHKMSCITAYSLKIFEVHFSNVKLLESVQN